MLCKLSREQQAYCFFALMFVFSVTSEIICSASITEWIIKNTDSLNCFHLPIYFHSSTIHEVIMLLGFSNVFIAIIYNSADKTVLGLTYNDLLSFRFKPYFFCSVAHILATLFCIITSTAGTSESALIAFIAVLYGFVYQCRVLYNININAVAREKIAVSCWEDKFSRGNVFLCLISLAESVPHPNSRHYKQHMKCLSGAFIKYVQLGSRDFNCHNIIWNSLPHTNSRLMMISDIFKTALTSESNDEKLSDAVYAMAAGYVAQQINSADAVMHSNEDNLLDVAKNLGYLICSLSVYAEKPDNSVNVPLYSKTVHLVCKYIAEYYLVYIWVLFQCGKLSLKPELFQLKYKMSQNSSNEQTSNEQPYLDELIRYLCPQLGERVMTEYIKRAQTQL